MNTYLDELANYGNTLTKEQLRIVCHISKRKATYLLQSGLIPCINTGKKTHTYIVAKSAVAFYLRDREENPQKYHFSSSVISNKNRSQTAVRRAGPILIDRDRMRAYYKDKLSAFPDVLTTTQVKLLIGYGENTVRAWIEKGELPYLDCLAGWGIPKIWLINFLCSSYCNRIARNSQAHLAFLTDLQTQESGCAAAPCGAE